MDRASKGMALLVGLAILNGQAVAGAGQGGRAIPDGLRELASELNRNHRYLLGEDEWAELDARCRQLSPPQERRPRRSPSVAERQAAAERSVEAAHALLRLLEKCPHAIHLSVSADGITGPIDRPVKVPGDIGALLFRIEAGEGDTRCTTIAYDMGESSGPEEGRRAGGINVKLGSPGVTWALVSLSHVPSGPSSLLVEFEYAPEKEVALLVDVVAPQPGRVRVSILCAATGRVVPAMIHLRWKLNGVDRRPPNGIGFGPQFDMRGERYGPRPARIPGRFGEYRWWCVPGSFDMTLPPGKWSIAIRRGVEHIPLTDTIDVSSGESTERFYELHRWIDMRTLGWYSGDDHVHCRIMNDEDARRLMAWAQAEDVHVVNTLKVGNIYRTFFDQRGFGKAYRVSDDDYVIVPGQECPRTGGRYAVGHTISLNTQSMVRDPSAYYLYDRVADKVHAQGGLFGYAHVQSNSFHVSRSMSLTIPRHKADFLEILQFEKLGTSLYYDFLNLGNKLTASAGTDVPWGGTLGEVRVYAYVGDGEFSADAWFEAVRRGRTFVSNGPMILFDVEGALPGDEIVVNENRRLRVRARAMGNPDAMLPLKLEIVRHGEVIRTAEQQPAREEEALIDLEVDADNGFWIAARAGGGDGSRAHTTPVYVVRRGRRFWKYDAVGELIDARLEELAEVEGLVQEAMGLDPDGRAATDLMIRELRLQGRAMLESIDEARATYEGLRQAAHRERPLRAAGAHEGGEGQTP